jgi:hypothetical protein
MRLTIELAANIRSDLDQGWALRSEVRPHKIVSFQQLTLRQAVRAGVCLVCPGWPHFGRSGYHQDKVARDTRGPQDDGAQVAGIQKV